MSDRSDSSTSSFVELHKEYDRDPFIFVAKSPEEHRVISVVKDGVKVWSTRESRKMRLMKTLNCADETKMIRAICMLDHDTALFSDDNYIKVLDLVDGEVLAQCRIRHPCFVCAAIDERTAVFGDNAAHVLEATWDGNELRVRRAIKDAHASDGFMFHMFAYGNWFVTVLDDQAKLWDANTMELVHCFEDDDFVVSASFNMDYFVMCGSAIRMYDIKTFELLYRFEVHGYIMAEIAPNKNVLTLFERCENEAAPIALRLYNVPDGELIGEYWGEGDYAYSFALLSDARIVLGGLYNDSQTDVMTLINVKELRRR